MRPNGLLSLRIVVVVLITSMVGSAPLFSMAGNPQIKTDHPELQGELSCSTYERVEASAFANFKARYGREPKTETDKVLALFIWRTEHHQHADGNLLNYGAGCHSALAGADGWGFCRDGLMGLFAHSTGLCFSIHSQFTPFVQRVLKNPLATSCTLVPGHTAFEALTDGEWRLFDITCGHVIFDNDPEKPVGILHLAKNQNRIDQMNGGFMKLRIGPFGDKLNTYDSVRSPEGDGQQKMFGYMGMPIVFKLRNGETFTRYSDNEDDDGVGAIWSQDYFQLQAYDFPKRHGTARGETFMGFGAVGNDNAGRYDKRLSTKENTKRPFRYSGKGVFEYRPDLKDKKNKSWEEGMIAQDKIGWKSNAIESKSEGAFFVIDHASPYPVAAHQADNADSKWDVVKNPCDKTAVFTFKTSGSVAVEISLDNGQTWLPAGEKEGDGSIDFSDIVKGRFAYQMKVVLGKKTAIKDFTLRTVVQIGPAVFPHLKENGSEVTYFADNAGVIHGGPDWRQAKAFRRKDLDSGNWMTYAINAPGAIRSLHGVTFASGRVKVRIETSLDGKNWDVALEDVGTTDTGHEPTSSIWGNGTCAIMWGDSRYPKGQSKTGYIRFLNGVENGTQVYATYDSADKAPGVDVEICWSDSQGAKRTMKKTMKPSEKEQTFNVPTGTNVSTHWIRFTPADK
ncbi:MAG: hypothetical protein ABIH86_00185 [Planctomycetota bacterium]